MLYETAHDCLVQLTEAALQRAGYRAGLGATLVRLHLDERFYVMPISVDTAAQEALLRDAGRVDDLVPELAAAVVFEDLSSFGGVLRVFARTLLNRAGVSDLFRGRSVSPTGLRQHVVPRVGRVLQALAGAGDYAALTGYDPLLATLERALAEGLGLDGPQGVDAEDLAAIRALCQAGVASTLMPVNEVGARQGWVKWVRGLHSGINCLAGESGFDLEGFRRTVQRAIEAGPAGPLDLGQRYAASVQEMGLALAMSFFGDLGYREFAKPDRHVINALEAHDSRRPAPAAAFSSLQWHASQAGVSPRRLDKIFYLAGSGNFYLSGFDFGPAFKQDFLEHLANARGAVHVPAMPQAVAAEAALPVVLPPQPDLAFDPDFQDRLGVALQPFYAPLLQQLAIACDAEPAQPLGLQVFYTDTRGRDLRVRWQFARPFGVLLCIERSGAGFLAYTRAPADCLPPHLQIEEIGAGEFRRYQAPGAEFVANAAALLSAILAWASEQRGG